MEKKMTFNYFYGTEADQFSFYRIPKALFTDSYFKDLSSDAKILYGLMLDRMSLSIKNQWFDDKNRAYRRMGSISMDGCVGNQYALRFFWFPL